MKIFDPKDWYWRVGGDAAKVYSSKRNIYVDPVSDPAHLAWVASGGVVVEIAAEAELWPYVSAFRPAWLFDGEHVAQPAADAYTPGQLGAYAADVRWRRETGGIAVAGLAVATDDRSKLMIAGARIRADQDPDFVTLWNGVTPITASEIVAVSDAVLAHVDLCFRKQGEVLAGIAAGTITTLEAIDAAFAAL